MPYSVVSKSVRKISAAVFAALALFHACGWAQEYPTKPIRVIVPWGAGGIVDVGARLVATPLSKRLSQPVVVENRSGANGMIGTDVVAKAAPDGYTLIVGNTDTHSIDPHVYPKIPYDSLADFVPVAPIAVVPLLVTARSALAADTLPKALELVKSQPGKFTFGSWGTGSVPHLAFLALMDQTGTAMLHVPHAVSTAAFNSLIGGQIDFMLFPVGMAGPLRKAGKLKVLGIINDTRSSVMSDVPTLKEQGYAVELRTIFGLLAPARTPASVIQRLSSEVSTILQSPEISEKLRVQGAEAVLMSPGEYARFLRADLEYWGKVVRKFNVKVQ